MQYLKGCLDQFIIALQKVMRLQHTLYAYCDDHKFNVYTDNRITSVVKVTGADLPCFRTMAQSFITCTLMTHMGSDRRHDSYAIVNLKGLEKY